MAEATETNPPASTDHIIHTLRSKIRGLREIQATAKEEERDVVLSTSLSDSVIRESLLHLQGQRDKIISDFSDIGLLPVADFDDFMGRMKEEIHCIQTESSKVAVNVDNLARKIFEDFSLLENDIVELSCVVDSTASQGTEISNTDALVASCLHDKMDISNSDGNCKFKIFELNDQIERKKLDFELLQTLDSILKRFEAVEQFEDALSGVNVTEYGSDWLRLSLRTQIPFSESFLSQHKLEEPFEKLEQNHELLIELVNATGELKNFEMFPNDVYISDIIEAAKAFWPLFSSTVEEKSSLEWLVRRVQDRIVLCILRHLLMKSATKSRHSFEYLDRDEMVTAHMVGGVNAYIKMPLGWPVSEHSLKLISLKSSDCNAKEISLSFLCKVEEMANSLDPHVRNNITSFMDVIEEILVQQMRLELQSS